MPGMHADDDREAEQNGQHDGQSAESRDGRLLPLARLIGMIEPDAPLAEPNGPRRTQQRHKKPDAEKKQGVDHRPPASVAGQRTRRESSAEAGFCR